MTEEDRSRADTRAHMASEDKSGKAGRDAALKAVTDNMARLKALRLAREAAEPPRLAAPRKARTKAKKSGEKEKGPALSDWLAGQQSGGHRT
jgi:hypothetical protein